MTLLEIIKLKAQHYPYEKHAKKMTLSDWALLENFIVRHEHLKKGDFELAVNRMFIDKEKPKSYITILELLTIANSTREL